MVEESVSQSVNIYCKQAQPNTLCIFFFPNRFKYASTLCMCVCVCVQPGCSTFGETFTSLSEIFALVISSYQDVEANSLTASVKFKGIGIHLFAFS